jgi:hypothetical protein
LEGLTLTDNELFFSFDKETFGNFKFNLTDDVISLESLTKTSFDQQTPLEAFVNTFCMFYKYSKIKHDDEFKTTISNFFDEFYKGDSFYEYSMVTVENYLEMLFSKIEEILKKKDLNNQPFLIEEVDGRIICKPNDSYKPILDEKSSSEHTFLMDETHKDYVDFLMKFNELYLKGFFKNDLVKSLEKLHEEYDKGIYDPICNVSKELDPELFGLYFKIHQSTRADNEKHNCESEEEIRKLTKLLLGNSLLKYAYKIIKRDLKGETPKYLNEKIFKVASKVFFYMSENQDIFSSYSAEEQQAVALLKEQFRKNFEGKNLSKCSMDSLVMRCLEVES